MKITTCRSCNRQVIWVLTAKGKKMPLDAEPDPAGRFVIENGLPSEETRARYLSKSEHEAFDGGDTYTSHFATCPHAESWRK